MRTLAYGLLAGTAFATNAAAEDITLRIGSGHPPGVVYAGLMIDFFQSEMTKRVEERTDHTLTFVEGYSGSIVTTSETLEGVQDGILDIGGFCFCFEPSNLPLHAFQVMLPFGTMDPETSLQVAQDVYAEVPYLTDVFPEEFNQILLARISDGGYNLGTNFAWTDLADLAGQKIAGAEDRRGRHQPELAGKRRDRAGVVVAGHVLYGIDHWRLQRLDHVPIGLGEPQAV
ncbi:hypothetical protein ACOI1H_06355 [Loktanella sp. DJP18]|uniref:hypothetical protein n=1 Tax=Loktanella sp. DJP18 TaxID=3409788 RepID=UPI003BB73BA5